jgi:hypothetical protein
MATIKFKRGSGVPTGLTAYEAAWDTSLGRFFINNGTTATWIGARIDPDTTLVGNCAYFVPTQNAVKTYVDNQVAGGAVSSVDGVTGAVDLLAGTGISITVPTGAAKGITIAVNSNVALLDTAQTFTALKSFSAGISAAGSGSTFNSAVYATGTIRTEGIFRGATLTTSALISGFEHFSNLGPRRLTFTFDPTGINEQQTLIPADLPSIGAGSHMVIQLPADSGTVALTKSTVSSVNGSTGAVVAVSSLNSATGAVSLFAGSGLSVASSTSIRGITFTNTGVLSNIAGSGISVSAATGNVTITNSGVTGLVAGTGISVSSSTGNVTVTNTGVQSIAGTANQITASGSTGAVTLSLPSAVTMPGSLTVTGNLVVNGTTTTVNSTTVTVQDPIIAIGGQTGNIAPASGDVKDRGIIYQYNLAPAGTTGATGFFGHDQSTGYFTYIPSITSVTGEVVSGTAGTAQFNEVRGLSGVTFTITAPATTSSMIEMRGGAAYVNTIISLEASIVEIGNYTTKSGIRFTENGRGHLLAPLSSMSANRTYDLPDHSGTVVVPSDLGSIAGYLLTSQGATAQPIWVKPDDAGTGITASAAKLLTVSSDTSDTTCFLTFINTASNSNQAFKYNSSLAYNAATNYLDVNIDCGAY